LGRSVREKEGERELKTRVMRDERKKEKERE
jgi:hypothetical protein